MGACCVLEAGPEPWAGVPSGWRPVEIPKAGEVHVLVVPAVAAWMTMAFEPASSPAPLFSRVVRRSSRLISKPNQRRIIRMLPSRFGRFLDVTEATPGQIATTDDIKALYRLLLDRPPDPSGYRLYSSYVENQSMPVEDLVRLFINSPEFRDRLQKNYSWTEGLPQRVDLLAGYPFYVQAASGGISGDIKAQRQYEPHLASILAASLGVGSCFVDVGASIGYYTVLAGRIVGPAGRVIACEPGPQNHSMLLLNVTVNELSNVTLHRVAISDTTGILAYSRQQDNGSISPFDGEPSALSVHDLIEAIPLDELLASVARIDVVKVDVEGAEGKVLHGADATIRRHRPTLFFELTPDALESVSAVTARQLLDDLEELGYSLKVLQDRSGDGGPSRPSSIMELFDESGLDHFDIMALPRQ